MQPKNQQDNAPKNLKGERVKNQLGFSRTLFWSAITTIGCFGTVEVGQQLKDVTQKPLDPIDIATEYAKVLNPLNTASKFIELQNEQTHNQEELADKLLSEAKVFSELVSELVIEEIIIENTLVVLTNLGAMIIPSLIEILFAILVSKAKLTTFSINKISQAFEQLEKGIYTLVTKLEKVMDNLDPNDATTLSNRLKQELIDSNPKKGKQELFKSKTKWLFGEIATLRRLITQIKLSVQLPIFYFHQGNLPHAYNSLTDSASPRFSHLIRGSGGEERGKVKTIFQHEFLPGIKAEAGSLEAWEKVTQTLGKKFTREEGKVKRLVTPYITNKDPNPAAGIEASLEVESSYFADLSDDYKLYDKKRARYEEWTGSDEDYTQIMNERYVGNGERILGFYSYYGVEGVTKLRVLFEVLKLLIDSVANLEVTQISKIKSTTLNLGELSEEIKIKVESTYSEKLNEQKPSIKANEVDMLTDENSLRGLYLEAVSDPNLKWREIVKYLQLLDLTNGDLNKLENLLNLATTLDSNSISPYLFLEKLVLKRKKTARFKWSDTLDSLKMPSWASEFDSIFDPQFLNFLIHFRFQADLDEIGSKFGKQVNLEQQIVSLMADGNIQTVKSIIKPLDPENQLEKRLQKYLEQFETLKSVR